MKTLIVYGTKHGSAETCSELLRERLQGEVTVVNIKKGSVPDLGAYDRIVIGSSIYIGSVHKEIKEFCSKNLEVLKGKKLGLFICCMNKSDEEKQINMNFPEELLKSAAAKSSFGGEFRFGKMGMLEKMMIKMVSKSQGEPITDTKKDISKLSEENIKAFVELMNIA